MAENKNEVAPNIIVSTIKMYDTTIEEMKERGASEADIYLVEQAKEDAIKAYMEPLPEVQKTEEYTTKKLVDNEFFNGTLLSNMFFVTIGEVPTHLIREIWINQDKKFAHLTVYEDEKFSACKYFSDNRKFRKLFIEYIKNENVRVRVDVLEGLKVCSMSTTSLNYESSEPIKTYITFKYKKYVPSAS